MRKPKSVLLEKYMTDIYEFTSARNPTTTSVGQTLENVWRVAWERGYEKALQDVKKKQENMSDPNAAADFAEVGAQVRREREEKKENIHLQLGHVYETRDGRLVHITNMSDTCPSDPLYYGQEYKNNVVLYFWHENGRMDASRENVLDIVREWF